MDGHYYIVLVDGSVRWDPEEEDFATAREEVLDCGWDWDGE